MSVFGTGFALVGELIPERGQFRARLTTTRSPIHYGFVSGTRFAQFVHRVPSGLVFGAHADTGTGLVARLYWCQTHA